mmetsp:Transcript_13297/g.18421  ORF Transcript_13297/g.18421 Transcript_13297/m.18421 type:complete len:129 (-) Transcript_13297:313-699(-)
MTPVFIHVCVPTYRTPSPSDDYCLLGSNKTYVNDPLLHEFPTNIHVRLSCSSSSVAAGVLLANQQQPLVFSTTMNRRQLCLKQKSLTTVSHRSQTALAAPCNDGIAVPPRTRLRALLLASCPSQIQSA